MLGGVYAWKDVYCCCVALAHLWVRVCALVGMLRRLWGPTAGGDVCVGSRMRTHGEVLKL